jgi:hypothetical protein
MNQEKNMVSGKIEAMVSIDTNSISKAEAFTTLEGLINEYSAPVSTITVNLSDGSKIELNINDFKFKWNGLLDNKNC